jgi:transcriptional regulator with XRE-family HTH domain
MRKSTHTAEYASLRARLVAVRTAAGLSQRGVAERLGVPHSWVAKVEAGERRIDLIEFGWFCAACGVSPAHEAAELFAVGSETSAGGRRARVTSGGRR